MTMTHHPSLEALEEYAAGSAPEPVALALAVHLSRCAACHAAVIRLEAIGGAALSEMPPVEFDADTALERALAALDEDVPADTRTHGADDLPSALVARLPSDLAALPWRRVARGVAEYAVGTAESGYAAKLLRIQPGAKVPFHTHRGEELTVVLKGGFRDADAMYGEGDFAVADPAVRHSPVATEDAVCYCLAVTNAPLRLLGPLGRLIDPLLQMRARA